MPPPPARTAYFSRARNPGVVFRVQTICALKSRTAETTVAVAVAIAASAVDLMSIGWLTHSAQVLDIGLDYLG